uniref:Dynein heavy chain hydrolytic ATP-binding dynein motor region domain-containing protein n=1 Tax=Periophthalmus magnuspinnatus TaxID=409849 RepID=A0A3B4ARX1_9GOBI
MKATVKDNIDRSLKVYCEQPREKWVLSWPGQVVIAGCQVFWTAEVSEAIEKGDLANLQLVRGDLSRMQRAVLSALIVIEVHAKDVAAELVQQKVSNINDFEWISQLRDDLYVRVVNAEFLYGYEYLGNSGRLVITPLTDSWLKQIPDALKPYSDQLTSLFSRFLKVKLTKYSDTLPNICVKLAFCAFLPFFLF